MPQLVIDARSALLGPGMSVQRILPFRQRRMVGPFIFMDHAGPVRLNPGQDQLMDVLPHPHIGLSTVTYLFSGEVTHRDGLGIQQVIKPGEVNWMTAGSGISHSERFENPAVLGAAGLEMLQTWVALPEKNEEETPSFRNYQENELPVVQENGLTMRLIAGEAFGIRSPVSTHSPLFYLHLSLTSGTTFTLPHGYSERALYISSGAISVGHNHFHRGQMVVFHENEQPQLKALEDSVIMMLGGEPLGERFIWWNFVSSRKDRIEQAKADWKEGRIVLPPMDNHEFVPLPDSPAPAPEMLS